MQAVYVATPHPMHHADALLALEAGKPVLVEKAFTMNAGRGAGARRTGPGAGLFLMEAMWTRFLPQCREIRRLVADGALGRSSTVMADHGQWFPRIRRFRLFAPELGGGALLDLGVYPVSLRLDACSAGRTACSRSSIPRSPAWTGRRRSCSATRRAPRRC